MKIGAAIAVLLMLPSAALGQGNPGPFGGLFGRTPERIGRDYTVFEVRSGANMMLDNQVVSASDASAEGFGAIGAVNGSATFEHRTTRLRTMARGLASYNEFIQTPRLGATTAEASGSMMWRIGTRFSVEGSAMYLYSPYFQFYPNVVPAPSLPEVFVPVSSYITGLVESDTVEASAGASSYYSKRSTLAVLFSHRRTSFRNSPAGDAGDYEMNGARATWTRRMNRDISLRLGYAREETRAEALNNVEYVYESIEAGVDFSRPLSLTRHTTMAFHTESALIARADGPRHFRLNGGINLQHWFSRTWSLSAYAMRSTEFLAGFTEPLFSDMVGTSLNGLLSPRMQLILSAGAGNGYFGVDGDQGRYSTVSTTARFGVALTRRFGVFAQHGFYFYELPPAAPVVSVVTPMQNMARQTIMFGATVWLPVINKVRSPSDSR